MADLTDHELTRRNCWIQAAASLGSRRYVQLDEAVEFADKVLKEYDKRFAEPIETWVGEDGG